MKYYSIKSIVLGIGIGIILTAGSGMVYSSFVDNKVSMTKEEIMNEAKKYGMVEQPSINIAQGTPTPTSMPTVTPVIKTPAPTPVPTITPAPTPTLGPEVIITVNVGDTATVVAKKLYDNKLINDETAFINLMIETNAASRMYAKEYTFRLGMDPREIITILTTR